MKDIQDLDSMVVLEKWIEFKEFTELEREDTIRDSEGGFQHTIAMVRSSTTSGLQSNHERKK